MSDKVAKDHLDNVQALPVDGAAVAVEQSGLDFVDGVYLPRTQDGVVFYVRSGVGEQGLNKDAPLPLLEPIQQDSLNQRAMRKIWSQKRVISCMLFSLTLLGIVVAAAYYLVSVATSAVAFNPSSEVKSNRGKPGSPWTREEALIVKAKLFQVFRWTRAGVDSKLFELHPDWQNGPWEEITDTTGRFAPAAVRLGFHGCFRDMDGTGGCDGCLYADGLDRIWMDYIGQKVLPFTGPRAPNPNGGLKPLMDILEEVYTNASYPAKSTILDTSLRDSGKSRSDLWAFAAIAAVEYTTLMNNMVCLNPNYEWPVRYPDSLDSNSQWGRHCTQKQGTPGCEVASGNRIRFKTGRRDCVTQLYQLVHTNRCPLGLDIKTGDECQRAGTEQGTEVAFSVEPDGANCKVLSANSFYFNLFSSGVSLCHLSVEQKYGSGPAYQVWNPLGSNIPLRTCRADLNITTEEDCKKAAGHLFLEYFGDASHITNIPTLDVSGCYVGAQLLWGGRFKWVVVFATGKPWPPAPSRRDIRSICRYGNQKVSGYMSSHVGKNPGNQMSGAQTVEYFRKEFGLHPRESIALMGAHTIGRFHSRSSLYRYIWIRNGGMMWNNEYFRNMAGRPGYRFLDDCTRIPNATGQPGIVRWDAFRRGEQVNHGPIEWILQRHSCPFDCRTLSNESRARQTCCQDMPEGGACNAKCDKWFSEPGNHEMMLPSEIGLYYKFDVNTSDEQETGCPGLANFAMPGGYFSGSGGREGPCDCSKQDIQAGDLKMHQVVELYADNQNLWAKEFNEVFEKVLQNGYDDSMLTEVEDTTTDIVCPFQTHHIADLTYFSCISKSQLSEPFSIVSVKDDAYLQVNSVTGLIETAPKNESAQNQMWYWATGVQGVEKQLVNGVMWFGVGRLQYDENSGKPYSWLTAPAGKGCLARGWGGYGINYESPCRANPTSANLYRFSIKYDV